MDANAWFMFEGDKNDLMCAEKQNEIAWRDLQATSDKANSPSWHMINHIIKINLRYNYHNQKIKVWI